MSSSFAVKIHRLALSRRAVVILKAKQSHGSGGDDEPTDSGHRRREAWKRDEVVDRLDGVDFEVPVGREHVEQTPDRMQTANCPHAMRTKCGQPPSTELFAVKNSGPLRLDRTLLTVRTLVGIRPQPVIEIRVVDQPSGQPHQFEAALLSRSRRQTDWARVRCLLLDKIFS